MKNGHNIHIKPIKNGDIGEIVRLEKEFDGYLQRN
jgi:hypothetical protein